MIKEIKDDSLLPKICNLENDLFNNDKYNKKQAGVCLLKIKNDEMKK